MERVFVKLDPYDPAPEALRRYIAEVFASLDERPRILFMTLDARNALGARVFIDLREGEPVACVDGYGETAMPLRRRWIAEHPVPLAVPGGGKLRLILTPTDANRVRVRKATLWERAVAAVFR